MPEQLIGASERILPTVLSVSIHGDDPGVWPALREKSKESRLQRFALPAVLRQTDHLATHRYQFIKILPAFRSAAVIHHDDVVETSRSSGS